MDGDSPVLTDRKDIKMWKRLTALERSAAKGSKKNVDRLRKIIQETLDFEGYVNPKVVVKIIDLVDLYLSDELQMIMLEILEKCKLTDCAPQLQAAEKLVRIGSYDSAKLILDRMTVISDVPQWEYLHGIVDVHEGNTKSAFRHFIRVYDLDDRFLQVYPELEQLEPEKGWLFRGMIASIMEGDTPISPANSKDGRFGDLYNAYWDWSSGNTMNALDAVKRMVREGIEMDVELAMARFYLSEKKYSEAIDHYQKAAEGGNYFVKMEFAKAQFEAGNYFETLAICSELEGKGISDRRLIELQLRTSTALKDRAGVVKYVKIYLYNDYADCDAYVNCIKSYIDLQMHSEASSLLEDMSVIDADDPMISLLSSKNDYSCGRYQTARASAKKAVRKMPKDIDCLLHISNVYIAMKRPEKATKYIEAILQMDDRNRDALLLKKDVFISKNPPEYDNARGQCEKIISYYPDDSETMRDLAIILSKMGKDEESLEAYKRSLNVKENPVLFMEIITSLAKASRYGDVVNIANEYDDVYGNNVDMWAIKGNAEFQTGLYQDAIKSYTKAVQMDHNRPSLWHSKGMAEEMAGEYDHAEVSYDKAVLMDLDNSEYWISKAAVQEKKEDYTGAINSLNRVISTHPENVYSLMRKAVILVRLGRDNEARTFIELASKIEPTNMKIMIARRDIYCKEGDTESTKAVCRNILNQCPGDKKTAIILARMHFKTGNLDDARAVLVEINVDKDGFSDEDYEIHQMLREIYHTQGKTHEEISTCKTILSFKPDDRATKVALAEAYIKKGMIDAAKALYDELHQQSPEDPDFSLKKAKMAEDSDAALSVLMESLTTDPDNKDVLLEVSRMLYEDDKLKDALVYVNRARESDPTDCNVYVMKIKILYRMKDYRGVLSTVEDAVANVRGVDPVIWKYSGDSQLILGDYSNALISYDTAMKMGLSTADIYHSRGMCQEITGMDEAAMNSYTIAYQKDPQDTDSMIRVAAIHLKQEKEQSAGRVLDQAISVDPLCSKAIVARATIFAYRGSEVGMKRLFDHCISKKVDDETKQSVAELMEKVRMKDPVALPVIPLEMPKVTQPVSGEQPEEQPAEAAEEAEEEISEGSSEEPSAEEEPVSEDAAKVDKEMEPVAEETSEAESPAEQEEQIAEQEEEPEGELIYDDESDSGFVVISSYDEEESALEEESAVVVEEPPAKKETPAAEEPPAAEASEDVVIETEEPEAEPVAEETSEAESPADKTVEEYALALLKFAHETGEAPDDDKAIEMAGIPADEAQKVFDYLSDIEEYGTIDPNGKDFETMERMSYNAIVRSGENDIDDDPVITLPSAFFESGANDIEEAKTVVSYVYAAMTCKIDKDAIYDRISQIADNVEFDGGPNTVFEIMSKYKIGVYSARAVKMMVSKKDQ